MYLGGSQQQDLSLLVGVLTGTTILEKVRQYLIKLKMCIPSDPAVLFLETHTHQ